MTNVSLRLSGGLSIREWERRHALGEVPSCWPYGLDLLAGHGLDLDYPEVTRAKRKNLAGRVVRRLTGFEAWETFRDRSGKPADVILCWDERRSVPEILLGDGRKIPVVTGAIWITDDLPKKIPHQLAKIALRKAFRVWTLSAAQIPILKNVFGLVDSQLEYIPFGVDAEFFTPAGGSAENGEGLVLSVGNDRHRNFSALVNAMGTVKNSFPNARLELVTQSHTSVPATLGYRLPSLSHMELLDRYRRCALVVIPTRPNLHVSGITAILEAMACAKAVVATDTPGIREYVTQGQNGILVPPDDPARLSEAITGLLHDPARARELGLEGRRSVESHFNTKELAARLAALIT